MQSIGREYVETVEWRRPQQLIVQAMTGYHNCERSVIGPCQSNLIRIESVVALTDGTALTSDAIVNASCALLNLIKRKSFNQGVGMHRNTTACRKPFNLNSNIASTQLQPILQVYIRVTWNVFKLCVCTLPLRVNSLGPAVNAE